MIKNILTGKDSKKELAEDINKETKTKIEPEISETPSTPTAKIVEVDEIVQLDLFDNL